MKISVNGDIWLAIELAETTRYYYILTGMKVNEAVNQLISHSTKMINACLLYAAVNLVPSPAVEG